MGKKLGKGRFDAINENIAAPLPPRPKTLLDYIYELEHKKASTREDALLNIIIILSHENEFDTLQEYFATCLYPILGCIKNGLGREKQWASRVLGLIALTASGIDNAQEIYTETFHAVTQVLTSTKQIKPSAIVTLLESFAIVTFHCASNSGEIEAAMQIIWGFITSQSKHNVPTNQQSTIISAWLFLMTKVNRWEITYKHWQGAISRFLLLLDDETICVAAGEALSLIYERDNIDKFCNETENLSSIVGVNSYSEKKKSIKNTILKKLDNVSTKAEGAKWDVLTYFKEDKCPKISKGIEGQELTLSSWSSIIQLKFLREFLGEELFSNHMLENKLFQSLFEFTPKYEENDFPCIYESSMEKIKTNVYLPEEQCFGTQTRKERKQERQLRQSIIDKSKTKILNKKRMFAEERKGKMYSTEAQLWASHETIF